MHGENMMERIISIGGAAGTGKTTIAHKICYIYDISQRIGTGFIREVVKAETNNPYLNYNTYQPAFSKTSYENLVWQTNAISRAINSCIDRAVREGTSLVVEGTHMIPWILNNTNVTHSIILYVRNEARHFKMINGGTHTKREISKEDFKEVRKIQDELVSNAKFSGVPLIEVGRDEIKVIEDIQEVIR